MFVYIMMLAAAVILGVILCDEKYGKVGKIIYCAVGAAAFTVISSVRYLVGTDFNTYGQMYVNTLYTDFSDLLTLRTEKGFLFFTCYLPGLLTDDYYAIFVITSIVIYFSIFWLIYKNSSIPWVSVSVFLCMGMFFSSLVILRQFIAGIIVTYALKFIHQKKSLYFFTLVFVAASFHWSALIMLVVYFLIRIKPGYVYLGLAAAATAVMFIFSYDILDFVVSKTYVYQNYDMATSVYITKGMPVSDSLIEGVIFAVFFLFRKRLMEKNPMNAVYINLSMFSLIFEVLSIHHAILARLVFITYIAPMLYLIPDAVIVIKEFIAERFRDGEKRLLANISAASAAAVFGIFSFLLLMSKNGSRVVPYMTIAERDIRAERPYLAEEELPSDYAEITFDEDDDDDEEEYYPDDSDDDDDGYDEDDEYIYDDDDDEYIDYEAEDEDAEEIE